MSDPTAIHHPVARYLHWSVAGLVILQFILAWWAERLAENDAVIHQLAVLAHHKSVGLTIFALALARVTWRLLHPPPPLPPMPRWQARVAIATHGLLYVLLFALPISGWLMSSASAYSVSWFNIVAVPDLLAPDPHLKSLLQTAHETLAMALFVVASAHTGAALVHHFYKKDAVLRRMLGFSPVAVGVLLLGVGVWQLAPNSSKPASAVPGVDSAMPSLPPTDSAPTPNLPDWKVDYHQSRIEFVGEQAGAPFSGTFGRWRAQINFTTTDLANSRALVSIDLASVNTNDSQRDDTLAQPEWFGGAQALFRASEFQISASGQLSAADATLTFRGQEHPVAFHFTVRQMDDLTVLEGASRLDRIQLGVGTGDWADTTWVGRYVDVRVLVAATHPN